MAFGAVPSGSAPFFSETLMGVSLHKRQPVCSAFARTRRWPGSGHRISPVPQTDRMWSGLHRPNRPGCPCKPRLHDTAAPPAATGWRLWGLVPRRHSRSGPSTRAVPASSCPALPTVDRRERPADHGFRSDRTGPCRATVFRWRGVWQWRVLSWRGRLNSSPWARVRSG